MAGSIGMHLKRLASSASGIGDLAVQDSQTKALINQTFGNARMVNRPEHIAVPEASGGITEDFGVGTRVDALA